MFNKICCLILSFCFFLTSNNNFSEVAPLEILEDTSNDNNSMSINLMNPDDFHTELKNQGIDSEDSDEYDIYLLIELKEEFSTYLKPFENPDIITDSDEINDSLLQHRKHIKKYYSSYNQQIADTMFLNEYNYFVSFFAPYIEIVFDDVAEYAHAKESIVNEAKNNQCIIASLSSFAITEKNQDEATKNDSSYETSYPFSDAVTDIGVNDSSYTGAGVKVGVIESGYPDDTQNLKEGLYTFLGNNQTSHCTMVTSIIGGKTGIAKDVDFYCIAREGLSFTNACNTLIDTYDVNIINMSNYLAICGYYSSWDSYIDNIVSNSGCTFVKSSGNGGLGTLISTPGYSMNAITVGSIDKNKNVSYDSRWEATEPFLLKPDIVAPGGYISNIDNVTNDYHGTSAAAAMVTGTIALLMEEFPTLKTNPAALKSLLHLGAETLPSQTDYYDEKAGFGLINYDNMRACRLGSNYANFIISYTAKRNAKVLTRNVTIPYCDEIFINVNSIINSVEDDDNADRITPNYTEYTINLIDTVTSGIVASSTVDSNVDFLTYKNTNPNNTSFRIDIVLDEDNTSGEGELASMAYEIVPHTHPTGYTWYSDTQHICSCICGEYSTAAHVVASGAFPNPEGYATCLLCGGDAFMGTLNSLSVSTLPHTANGSYKLQNGVIVLVEEDMEAYLNGTLVFYTGEIQ